MNTFGSIKLWSPLRKPTRCICCGRRSYRTCLGSDTMVCQSSLYLWYIRSLIVERLSVYPFLRATTTRRFVCFRTRRVAWKKKQVKFLSTSSVNYLHSSVKPFFLLYKVFMTCKSIRVAQLANEVAFFVCGTKIVRQTMDVF